ncbi:MAG: polyprenyl synthetase family protein [Clostridiales bacterium]|nr:polyprenyl synthetase family protein [Clostridiales bacterium]MCF8021184.1 polyprenyl synthetase family protein [Clostridiales bacterium]
MDFKKQLEEKAAEIDKALNEYMPSAEDYPPVIHEAMRYSIMAGGKRLRPVLTIAAAETVGADPVPLMPAACAMELIHTYSLVHDDLPAMDNDDLRRGQPTNHKKYGEAVAVLVGDALLTRAFGMVARAGKEGNLPSENIVQVILEMSEACGSYGLIGGQVVDTIYENRVAQSEDLEYIHTRKTGALYKMAVRTGVILSGAEEWEINALTNYAGKLGLVFQIIDDILDVEGDSYKLGKPTGSDKKNKKATYPSLFGMAAAREKAETIARDAAESLRPFGDRAQFLIGLLDFILLRDF